MSIHLKEKRIVKSGETLGKYFLQMVEENLALSRWKFNISFTNFLAPSSLTAIYDSEYCRISFMYSRGHTPQFDELAIEYGRVHASNENPYIRFHGEECRCWHNVVDPLRFLDGLSPSEAVQQSIIHKRLPPIMESFRKSDQGIQIKNEYSPNFSISMHSIVWDYYGQRLFGLFDIRKPDLWKEYRIFIKEYYEILGMKASYGPPYENIC